MRDPDLKDALERVAEIHAQVARASFYRGYRALPVAAMGVLALLAAGWQQVRPPSHPDAFAAQWVGVAVLSVGLVALDLGRRWSEVRGRDTARALGQMLPSLAVGLLLTHVLWERAELLPGVWASTFGLGVLASSPFLPRAVLGIALFYVAGGSALLLGAEPSSIPSPWGMGLMFGIGQLATAAALHQQESEA